MITKALNVKLPLPMYEAFFRVFPGHGERTHFIRMMISYAIECEGRENCFTELVRDQIERDLS